MNSHRIIATAAALALAVTPVALAKKGGESNGKGKEKSALKGQNGKGKGKNKAKNVTLKGTVISADAAGVVVMVEKSNKHGRHLVGTQQTFTATKVNVADTNGDLAYTTDDIADGDKVVVQARIAKDAVGPYAARHVVDQTNPKPSDDEEDEVEAHEDEAHEAPADEPVVTPTA